MVNLGLAVGVPLALVAVIGLVVLLGFLYWRWRKRRKGFWDRQSADAEKGAAREQKKSVILLRQPSKDGGEIYVVRHFHQAEDEQQLTLHTGRFVEVLEKSDNGWWRGTIDDRSGWFPANFVRPLSVTDKVADSLQRDATLAIMEDSDGEKDSPSLQCKGHDNKALVLSQEEIPSEETATKVAKQKEYDNGVINGGYTPSNADPKPAALTTLTNGVKDEPSASMNGQANTVGHNGFAVHYDYPESGKEPRKIEKTIAKENGASDTEENKRSGVQNGVKTDMEAEIQELDKIAADLRLDKAEFEIASTDKSSEKLGTSVGSDSSTEGHYDISDQEKMEHYDTPKPISSGYDNVDPMSKDGYDNLELKIISGYDNVNLTGNIDPKTQSGYDNVDQTAVSGYDNIDAQLKSGYDNLDEPMKTGYDNLDDPSKSGYDNLDQKVQGLGVYTEEFDTYEEFEDKDSKQYEKPALTVGLGPHLNQDSKTQKSDLAGERLFVALYPFVGSSADQLSLKPNDVIRVTGSGGELNGWIKGELKGPEGLQGWLPVAYIREITASQPPAEQPEVVPSLELSHASSEETLESTFGDDGDFDDEEGVVTGMEYRSVHPYSAQQEGDLSFSAGETIIVLDRLDNGWWRGCCQDREGWFPGTYVEAIPQTPATTLTAGFKFGTGHFEKEPPLAFSSPREDQAPDDDKPSILGISTSPIDVPEEPTTTDANQRPSVPSEKPAVPKRFVVPKLVKIPRAKFSSLKKLKGAKTKSPSRPAPAPPTRTISKDAIQVVTVETEDHQVATGRRKSLPRPTVPPPQPPPEERRRSQEEAMLRLADLAATQEVIVQSEARRLEVSQPRIDTETKRQMKSNVNTKDGEKPRSHAGEFDSILASLNKDIEALYDTVAEDCNKSTTSGSDDDTKKSVEVRKTEKGNISSDISDKGKFGDAKIDLHSYQPLPKVDLNTRPVMEVKPWSKTSDHTPTQKGKSPPRPAPPDALAIQKLQNGSPSEKDKKENNLSPVKIAPKRPDPLPKDTRDALISAKLQQEELQTDDSKVSENYKTFSKIPPAIPPKPDPGKVHKYRRTQSDLSLSPVVRHKSLDASVTSKDLESHIDKFASDLPSGKASIGGHSKSAPPRPAKPPRSRSRSLGAVMQHQDSIDSEEEVVKNNEMEIAVTGDEKTVGQYPILGDEGVSDVVLAPPVGFQGDETTTDEDVFGAPTEVSSEEFMKEFGAYIETTPEAPNRRNDYVEDIGRTPQASLPYKNASLSQYQMEDDIEEDGPSSVEHSPSYIHQGTTQVIQTPKQSLSTFKDPNVDSLTPAKESYGLIVQSKDVGMTPKIMLQYKGAELTEYSVERQPVTSVHNREYMSDKRTDLIEQKEVAGEDEVYRPTAMEPQTDLQPSRLSFEEDGSGEYSYEHQANIESSPETYQLHAGLASSTMDSTEPEIRFRGFSSSAHSSHPVTKVSPPRQDALTRAAASSEEAERTHLRFYTPAKFVRRVTHEQESSTTGSDLDMTFQPGVEGQRSSVEIRPVRPILEARQRDSGASYNSDDGPVHSPHSSLVDLSAPRPYRAPSLYSSPEGDKATSGFEEDRDGAQEVLKESYGKEHRMNRILARDYLFQDDGEFEGEESIV